MNNKRVPTVEFKLEPTIEEKSKVISLFNSHLFFLGRVFIVFEEEGYRLVVKRGGEIITNKNYKTVNEAKIAFLEFHGSLAFKDDVVPIWSHIYPPEKEWLEEKLEEVTTF
jgi:hypothetical protein